MSRVTGTRRVALVVVALLAVLLVASQLLIPPTAEERIRERLTADGGTAEVSLTAVPALRLLFQSGDRLDIRAEQIAVELAGGGGAFERLDRFGAVQLEVADATAGPVEVRSFVLERAGDEPYAFEMDGSASPRALAGFAAEQVSGPLGGLAADFAPLPDDPVPIEISGELASDDGRVRLVSGGGSIAGIPAGPVVAAIAGALIDRIGL
jgi:hypothetical protein